LTARLVELGVDPITGERIRASRRTQNRYEHPTPGAMTTPISRLAA